MLCAALRAPGPAWGLLVGIEPLWEYAQGFAPRVGCRGWASLQHQSFSKSAAPIRSNRSQEPAALTAAAGGGCQAATLPEATLSTPSNVLKDLLRSRKGQNPQQQRQQQQQQQQDVSQNQRVQQQQALQQHLARIQELSTNWPTKQHQQPGCNLEGAPDLPGQQQQQQQQQAPKEQQQQPKQEMEEVEPSLLTFDYLLAAEKLKLEGRPEASHLSSVQRGRLKQLLFSFTKSAAVKNKARAAYINKELFPSAANGFSRFMMRAATPALVNHLHSLGPGSGPQILDTLLDYFVCYCRANHASQLSAYEVAASTLDLRGPHTWYPYARAVQRSIHYHGGPTNSGKTYNALQALASAPRGVYCGPLRLLAMEVYESLNAAGVKCDLVTGQEVIRVPGAQHVACTVEMASLTTHVDVGVVDEIQMIGDDQRGFAWTRAILGLPANQLHVCGDLSAVPLVQGLAAECGDDFNLVHYERMTPLSLQPEGLANGWKDVKPGDCIVAFRRSDIYRARKKVAQETGLSSCIVYGALPAETRRAQARQFNDPDSDAKVLIASDAIGMGLNFNIRRVIFTTMKKKTTGGREEAVPVTLVKQIAGRAGRRNSDYPEGLVTTLNAGDYPFLEKSMAQPLTSLKTPKAGLYPEFETIELLSGQMPHLTFYQLLATFAREAQLDGKYFFSNQDQLLQVAKSLEQVQGLSLEDRFVFCMAPIPRGHMPHLAFIEFAHTYAAGQPVVVSEDLMPSGPPRSERQMLYMEDLYKVLAMWLWLSNRFEDAAFPGRGKVQAMAAQLCLLLDQGLTSGNQEKTSRGVSSRSRRDSSSGSTSSSSSILDSAVANDGSSSSTRGGAAGYEATVGLQLEQQAETVSSSSSSLGAREGSESELSSESESDWEDAESGATDGVSLQLHVVHHHHAMHHHQQQQQHPGVHLQQESSKASTKRDTASSCSGSSNARSSFWQQQQRPWPWVLAMTEAAKTGELEDQLIPKFDPSMVPFVRFKQGTYSKLVVPQPPGAVATEELQQ